MSIFEKLFKRPTLRQRVKTLEEEVAELKKKTISQATMKEEAPPSFNQIVDEWLNGEEDDDGN